MARRRQRSGSNVPDVGHIGLVSAGGSDPEALDAIDRATQHAPSLHRAVDNINGPERPTGTSSAAALRRLRKDRPDLNLPDVGQLAPLVSVSGSDRRSAAGRAGPPGALVAASTTPDGDGARGVPRRLVEAQPVAVAEYGVTGLAGRIRVPADDRHERDVSEVGQLTGVNRGRHAPSLARR